MANNNKLNKYKSQTNIPKSKKYFIFFYLKKEVIFSLKLKNYNIFIYSLKKIIVSDDPHMK